MVGRPGLDGVVPVLIKKNSPHRLLVLVVPYNQAGIATVDTIACSNLGAGLLRTQTHTHAGKSNELSKKSR